ncbi:S41 family peptidase [Enterococcus alishanensis]|uniref:S41 family peptidase n=1 Tax=Enterococcus alishanensis TaxID=1303817 RepID=A0ABS6TAU0_9ENTE|nr:S41 family peptidase [Enterococcus alishanensis]MBV7390028.1 S41 family peptidase [Enterococcus alishanensis]
MHKRTIPLPIFLVGLFFTVVVTAVVVHFIETRASVQNQSVVRVTRSDLDEVQDLYDLISTNYVEEVSKKALVEGGLSGMTAVLDDEYSEFLTAEETKKIDESVSSNFGGIGTSINLKDRLPVIEGVPIKNSPAEKASLKAGDIILAVDGQSTENQTIDETANKIRGKKDTEVSLLIRRGEEEFSVDLKREVVPNETVMGEINSDNPTIGYVELTNFRETTALEFRNTIEDLRTQGATSFVVDIRQNSGNLLSEAERVASYFLSDGDTIAQFSARGEVVSTEKAGSKIDSGFKVIEPTVFLVDQETAFGSEVLAAAVKHKGFSLVGVNTFGKGTIQNVLPIGENNYLQLTVMNWLTPDGSSIDQTGVKPTIQADYPDYAKLPPISTSSNWRVGDNGEVIKNINVMLAALGYETSGDSFNEQTLDAVKDIQINNNMEATGVVDEPTAKNIQESIFQLVKENDTAYQSAVDMLKINKIS